MTPRDRAFLDQFEDCSLPDEAFRHVGHVRMAWLYLGELPFNAALAAILDGIRRFGVSRNALGMFHVTVTVAFATIIASRMQPGESFRDFTARNPDLMSPRPLLRDYYSQGLLDSKRARNTFVPPDLQPLPQ